MLPYQEQYVRNAEEIGGLWQFTASPGVSFEDWYEERLRNRARLAELKKENAALLNDFLYPALDALYEADDAVLKDLEAFADHLMDWKTNMDCGVYVAIHDALLAMERVRKNRDGVIRELYKLGMGLYYLNRILIGISGRDADAFQFYNEMLFTEASSYLRYFDELGDEETRGYVIRCLANITLCTKDPKKRIDISMRTLKILRDEETRKAAPGLPWDVFIRRTHQQMSTNRSALNRSTLTRDQIAAVLDSCYEVFRQEEGAANPSVRWLWPYYNMEFSCGYVGLEETVNRLERLISGTPFDQYDMSGFYGNVELAVEYGTFLKRYPSLAEDPRRIRFLDGAYRKMMRTLMTNPPDAYGDYFVHTLAKVYNDFYEIDGLLTYREVLEKLMPRYSGAQYVLSRTAGDMMKAVARSLLASDPAFFDDISRFADMADPARKEEEILCFAGDCGLYHNFGLCKMNVERLNSTRPVFEGESRRIRLHTVSGYDDLRARPSTAMFADAARGHHSAYSGGEEDPSGYVRMESPYRKMTDVCAAVSWLLEEGGPDVGTVGARERIRSMTPRERNRFSPPVLACLTDAALCRELDSILCGDGEQYYREIYRTLTDA
ncbi:MAG: hypothetical protein E7576_05180 [Ruminococcaceae bacterium]|jgi:hypothetical protein|nr:hypothetical protein [Oscillospiraceae bacterium]